MRFVPIFALTLLAATGCGDDESGGSTAPDPATVSFAAEVQPVFDDTCAVVCHQGAAPNGNLDLTAGQSRANLVNVPAAGYEDIVRVVPGDADASLLFRKLTGDAFGNRMPLSGSLADSLITRIQTWIEEGARDN